MAIATEAMSALDAGNYQGLAAWLDRGGDLYSRADNGETLLHKAAYRGHLHMVKDLLKRGLGINLTDQSGYTPLHEAGRAGHYLVAAYLMEHGADPELRNTSGKTAQELAREKSVETADMIANGGLRPRWLVTGDDEVSRISPKADIGYRLTEIFNFGAKSYVLIARNMVSGVESLTMKSFGEVGDTQLVEKAEDEFTRLGGHFPEGYSQRKLDKPSLLSGRRRLGG